MITIIRNQEKLSTQQTTSQTNQPQTQTQVERIKVPVFFHYNNGKVKQKEGIVEGNLIDILSGRVQGFVIVEKHIL